NKLREMQQSDNHASDSARFFFVMMPDLAPKETAAKRSGRTMATAADMLGAVNPDARRDPKFGTRMPDGWSYRPTTKVGEFEGGQEGWAAPQVRDPGAGTGGAVQVHRHRAEGPRRRHGQVRARLRPGLPACVGDRDDGGEARLPARRRRNPAPRRARRGAGGG